MSDDNTVRLDGRVAVVTGAGRGLGREFALALARRGAAVVVNDVGISADAGRYEALHGGAGHVEDAEPARVAQQVVEEIRQSGGRAHANFADVGDPAGAASIVADAVHEFGRIDIIVNNAGVVITRPFTELTPADLETVHRVHVLGSFHVAVAAWTHFIDQKYGRVINICSVEGGLLGSPDFSAYAAGKGAVVGLTRALAAEGSQLGILVNGVLPAAATRASALSGKKRATNVDRSASLVAPAVIWLAHEDCDVSGQLFAATAASMRLVFSSTTDGYQPDNSNALTIDELRENWEYVCARDLIPADGR
jgi:NAD(P)-dependent dehydrogenase (short-subunit alcohol dehydrogenase family)